MRPLSNEFADVIRAKQKEIHKIAKDKGFYDEPVRPLEAHMLIVSEIAEASEEIRKGSKPMYRVGKKYEGELIELADVFIRLLDYCESQGFDLASAVDIKMDYNRTRPYKHGKVL